MDEHARRESTADGRGNMRVQVKGRAETLCESGHFLQGVDW